MAMSISAYLGDELAARFVAAMEAEGRKESHVGATAVDLYTSLPLETRRALQFVQQAAKPEDRERLALEVARAIARVQFEIAQRQVTASMQVAGLETMSDEQVDELAVKLGRSRRRETPVPAPRPARPGGSARR